MRCATTASDGTATIMSMMGFAASPGTAVLPKCSMRPINSGGSKRRSSAASASKHAGQAGS